MSLTEYVNLCESCQANGPFDAKFCPQCGGKMERSELLPYVGMDPNTAVYRITLVAERAYSCKESAEEAAGKSRLYEDDDFDSSKVVFVRSACPPKTHPFVCTYCRDKSDHPYTKENPTVSETDQGRCEDCGWQAWEKR